MKIAPLILPIVITLFTADFVLPTRQFHAVMIETMLVPNSMSSEQKTNTVKWEFSRNVKETSFLLRLTPKQK